MLGDFGAVVLARMPSVLRLGVRLTGVRLTGVRLTGVRLTGVRLGAPGGVRFAADLAAKGLSPLVDRGAVFSS